MRTFFSLLLLTVFCTCGPAPELSTDRQGEILWAAAWSPGGKSIAVGGNYEALHIFSGNNFRQKQSFPIPNTITQLAWHPGGELLAVATQISEEKSVLLNTATGETQPLGGLSEVGARAIGWNFDGTYLAVGDNDGTLSIYSRQGELLRQVDLGTKIITGLSWHPTRNLVAGVGDAIGLYDMESGEKLVIDDRPESVLMLSVAWHPSGAFFVTGDYGDFDKDYPPLLQYWSAAGERIRSVEASQGPYRDMEWSSDGTELATASDALRIWSTEGELLRQQPNPTILWGIDWRPDDRRLVTTDAWGKIKVWSRQLGLKLSFEEGSEVR